MSPLLQFLLIAACFREVSSNAESTQKQDTSCFTPDEVLCLMARNCSDGLHDALFPSGANRITFNRVRFPGSASSDERNMVQHFEGKGAHNRYGNLATQGGCHAGARLCFAPSDHIDLGLAFRSVDNARAGSHGPFDTIERAMVRARSGGSDDSRVMLTTLREPMSYATKWYRFRETWDKTTDLSNVTFEEWIERAPWRTNFVTRVLGAKGDRKSTTSSMLHTKEGEVHGASTDRDAFLEDDYMTKQNELGPENSEVYRLALDRLRNVFVHFSIFHRLPESWELLAHTFCWDLDDDKRHITKANARGANALNSFAEKSKVDVDVEKAVLKLTERNKLDLALVEEAEKIMNERLKVMRADKANGIVCNFLGKVKVTCENSDAPRDEL